MCHGMAFTAMRVKWTLNPMDDFLLPLRDYLANDSGPLNFVMSLAALILSGLALRLNYLRYHAAVSDKAPDIDIGQIETLSCAHGQYFAFRYEVTNRSDKGLYLWEVRVKNMGRVAYSRGLDGLINPEMLPFDSDAALNSHGRRLEPKGAPKAYDGTQPDRVFSNVNFQSAKQTDPVMIRFVYSFGVDGKRQKKTFKRNLPLPNG